MIYTRTKQLDVNKQTKTSEQGFRFAIQAISFCLILCISLTPLHAIANNPNDIQGRISTGLKLFRSILLADRDIASKVGEKQQINIVFLYRSDMESAERYARNFVRLGRQGNRGKIKDYYVKINILKELSTVAKLNLEPAGIFILEDISPEQLQNVADYGKRNSIVTFSPHEGHIQHGILGSIDVGTSIRPMINTTTLTSSNLRIKSFFLKVATTYE